MSIRKMNEAPAKPDAGIGQGCGPGYGTATETTRGPGFGGKGAGPDVKPQAPRKVGTLPTTKPEPGRRVR